MADTTTLERFMDGYLTAWSSNDPDDIRALFTEDAQYRFAPHDEPSVGHDAIVSAWLATRDDPEDWSFEWTPVAIDGGTAVIEGRTVYEAEETYRNLWVVVFADDGRARAFTEWYMVESGDDED